MSTRKGSRRDYRHFPEEYAHLVRAFGRDGRASLGPMTEREARNACRDLYRYKMFLSEACDADADDPYARELFDMFNAATLRVEPCAVADDDRTHLVAFVLNPIVAAVRAMTSKGDING